MNKFDNPIADGPIRQPGDLISTDQAKSSTLGGPLNNSAHNSEHTIKAVISFVDSVSKKMKQSKANLPRKEKQTNTMLKSKEVEQAMECSNLPSLENI
eukprot:14619940-Ditylum_brightwellii.AAC.1